ncbi:hypothetical protein [Roseibium alexandrii]|uniref:Uncharacterized protein n=1 Tax=Roseibium alexandrii TaxID=388408 RepID=A0A0M6ZYF9_9HYPH|nr:hypothetical protein [Roseibium alexandrii]CTQ67202.1 hypothetical protein LAX5112_01264 [Roseibium alexandrii]
MTGNPFIPGKRTTPEPDPFLKALRGALMVVAALFLVSLGAWFTGI